MFEGTVTKWNEAGYCFVTAGNENGEWESFFLHVNDVTPRMTRDESIPAGTRVRFEDAIAGIGVLRRAINATIVEVPEPEAA